MIGGPTRLDEGAHVVGAPTGAGVRRLDLLGRERQMRAAIGAMGRIAASFARAARRSMPFLSRYRTRISPGPVDTLHEGAPPPEEQSAPAYTVRIASADGSATGTVGMDAASIALTLEGALGGTGAVDSVPAVLDLTPAQRALIARIARSLALDFASAIRGEVGLELTPIVEEPADAAQAPKPGNAIRVACEIEGLPVPTFLVLTAGAEALETAARERGGQGPVHGDPRIAAGVLEAPLVVVAELGKVTLGLRRVLTLRPGDVIRLATATDDTIDVRVAGLKKFKAVPVTSRGQLAVEIRERHEE
jgi:flagellar motor switch protein FliM